MLQSEAREWFLQEGAKDELEDIDITGISDVKEEKLSPEEEEKPLWKKWEEKARGNVRNKIQGYDEANIN